MCLLENVVMVKNMIFHILSIAAAPLSECSVFAPLVMLDLGLVSSKQHRINEV